MFRLNFGVRAETEWGVGVLETSRDWDAELVATLLWLARGFGIAAVCFLVVAWLLIRTTVWGRQFWRINAGYFTGRASLPVWGMLALILLFTLFAVRMSVLFSYQGNDQFTALQAAAAGIAQGDQATLDAGIDAFWAAVRLFIVLAIIHVVRILTAYWITSAFDIRWRSWLIDRTTDDWLGDQAYYRNRFVESRIDNPDQRIQLDTANVAIQTRQLAFGAVSAITSLISFSIVLWELSGPLTLFGVTIPRALVWFVIGYVLLTTIIAFWLGRPLIGLNFRMEQVNANFRYALVRLRDSAERVAFFRGEVVEGAGLRARFSRVVSNFWAIVYRTLKFDGWNLSVNQVAQFFPMVVQAPRFFAGDIALGGLTQSSSAYTQVHASLSFFREAYGDFTEYRASLIRLDGLMASNGQARALASAIREVGVEGLQLSYVDVSTPDDRTLISDLNLTVPAGEAIVVKGPSGAGKTTLLRVIAGIWPFASGTVTYPEDDRTLFLSQMPYLPLGDLRTVVVYPAHVGDFDDETIRAALTAVQLGHLAERLDEEGDWAAILSPGEQQRIAFARILLIRPDLVLLDEATSAVDEGLEYALYTLLRTQLPTCAVVSVGHRSTIDAHHDRILTIEGDGPWRITAGNPAKTLI